VEKPRTFRIDRGIGHYEFNDYYAILGLPLTAEASHVRKRYLMIAKCLHPDIHGRTPTEKQVATQYLSKLVNPAYDVLSQERERTEYSAILKLLGKRLMKRNQKFTPQSEIAQKYLISAKFNNYEQTVQELAKVQYQDLSQALENIGLLSELNLVHILIQEGYKHPPDDSTSLTIVSPKPAPLSPNSVANQNNSSTGKNTSTSNGNRVNSTYPNSTVGSYQMRSESQVPPRTSINQDNKSNTSSTNNSAGSLNNTQNKTNSNFNSNYKSNLTGETNSNNSSNSNAANYNSIEQYIVEAEKYISKQSWGLALKELRSAIQVDCNSSKCHALLGFVYMHQKLVGMAKVSFQQALKLNPEEPLAMKYINQVGGVSPNVDPSKTKPKDDKKGGFFGWLGGG
jgi:curved DNA-binding protein CbpA